MSLNSAASTSIYSWNTVLNMKSYLLSMDKSIDRFNLSMERLLKAGFTNISKYRGLDAETDNLQSEWIKHGSPKFDPADPDFIANKGKQACALGHYGIWADMIANNIPYALVFEDDVEFHKYWQVLAKEYWNATPKDFDLLYMGSQIESTAEGTVLRVPVYCTHAYMISLAGAKKLYELCVHNPAGTRTIDCIIIDVMHNVCRNNITNPPFSWYVWRATKFYDANAHKKATLAKRNMGLIFQDADIPSYIYQM